MFLEILKVFILSLVEGTTEFIPVSSTGHMIIVERFIKLSTNKEFVDSFQIIIQLGAIMAVVVFFWHKIWPFSKNKTKLEKEETFIMWSKIIIAFLPAAILGFLFDNIIESTFFNPLTVSITLVFYGIVLLFIENKSTKKIEIESIKHLSYRTAVIIGLFQCLAMIPGTSRSAATIIGGLLLGLSRVLATEFSFFLAIPTMSGATTLKILKSGANFSLNEWFLIALGFVLSFIFAHMVIKIFLSYVSKHNFKIFGYYRIVLGIIVFILVMIGVLR